MKLSLIRSVLMIRFEFFKGFFSSSKFTLNRIIIDERDVKRLSKGAASESLRKLFIRFGSDKSTEHDYEMFYSQIIYTLPPGDLLEIGIGTNNPDLQSTMGKSGRPGASLFAWQESHMFQKVFGADIDKEILFNHEVGIKTFYVDQTNVFDLSMLKENLAASRISIIIDDGLHEPQANMTAFQELWEIVLPGGVYCIEDVKQSDLLPLIIELAPYLQEFEWSIYQNFHRKIDNSIICIRKIYRDKS